MKRKRPNSTLSREHLRNRLELGVAVIDCELEPIGFSIFLYSLVKAVPQLSCQCHQHRKSAVVAMALCFFEILANAGLAEVPFERVYNLESQITERPQGTGIVCANRDAWNTQVIAERTLDVRRARTSQFGIKICTWSTAAKVRVLTGKR